jgi:acyl-CoA oxidase
MRKNNLSLDEGMDMRNLMFFPGGLELHIGMFIPSILSQGTPEQQAKWLPLSNTLRIIGTYAQTELGHGTFIRGLETLAVYDPTTQSFIVHSPTPTATKWWPGGLGKTATHVILMARLITNGRDYGPHGFVMQIRDMETHRPLHGIEVGDIGPKMGFNGVDNGWMRFDHVRIPRDAMLMRFSKVTEEGKYVPPPPENQKASYATMVFVRATIVRDAGDFLGRAVTISTRYTAIRRQTIPSKGEKELQVLDYDNVQQTLLPMVAKSYAMKVMGMKMMEMYESFDGARDRGDFSALPELHALSSGLKSLCTELAAGGIETCRRLCGGHGYSVLSGLPTLFASYVQNVTWEGDNNVMYLQAARYLLKTLASGTNNSSGSTAYLARASEEASTRSTVSSPQEWSLPQHGFAALRHATAKLALVAAEALRQAGGGQLVFEGAPWNNTNVDLICVARSHCCLFLHQTFVQFVEDAASRGDLSSSVLSVLRKLTELHAVTLLEEEAATLLESGHITGTQASWLRVQKRALVRALRPDAVALVDGFGYNDYILNSAIGRKDGDVYTALLAAAKSSPLNATQEGPAWKPVLEPLLNPKMRGGAAAKSSRL